jgi:hypothetical protein
MTISPEWGDVKNTDSTTGADSLDRPVRLFPYPWSFDVSPQEVPPARNSATIYAADSTHICKTRGEYAEALAKMIVESVNHFTQNVAIADGESKTQQTQ